MDMGTCEREVGFIMVFRRFLVTTIGAVVVATGVESAAVSDTALALATEKLEKPTGGSATSKVRTQRREGSSFSGYRRQYWLRFGF